MRVTTDELRRATAILLAHLDGTGRREIDLGDDYYWDVAAEQRHDMRQQPELLGVGQLSDDLAELRALLREAREPVGYALVWLSHVLRAVGERAVG